MLAEQNKSIRMAFVGDIFPGELPYTIGYGLRTRFLSHKGVLFKGIIKEIIGENDIVIGNLESPILANANERKKTFFGDPEFARFLKNNGINVLNLANNHVLEHGDQGFRQTVNILKGEGINIIGTTSDKSHKIYFKDIKGIKIAVAGFNNVDLNVINDYEHFDILSEEKVITALKIMAEENANVKILIFHWGNEYIHIPSLEQRKLAYKFIENGANIIIGHHPHVIQPYEQYQDGHIFYSLGNFIFDNIHSEKVSKGLVVNLEVREDKLMKFKLSGVQLDDLNIVSKLPYEKFKEYFKGITELYSEFQKLTEKEYEKRYILLQKRDHTIQRILMKTYLMKQLIKIPMKNKKLLIRNLVNYFIK